MGIQPCQLALPANQGTSRPPCGVPLELDAIVDDRKVNALNVFRWQRFEFKRVLCQPADRLGDNDRARFGERGLERRRPRREVERPFLEGREAALLEDVPAR